MLDLESVRLFILAVEFGGLTRAAEAAGTVQPAVSQRIKALEARLGRRLLERSPRFVRPTADGEIFLERARRLLAAHDEALDFAPEPSLRLRIGLSDHAVGLATGPLLGRLRLALPKPATLEVRTGLSLSLRAAYDAGELDAVVVRREAGGADGEVLGVDPLGWRAGPAFSIPPGASVPLATLVPPCGVRAVAIRALEAAGRPWTEAFVGGSCAALVAAVRAGVGVAPMGWAASEGLPDAGPALGLPPLPASEVVLHARAATPAIAAAIRALAAGVRSALPPRAPLSGRPAPRSPARRRPQTA
jgi:DNA-binding transcriptional LysR family regulator